MRPTACRDPPPTTVGHAVLPFGTQPRTPAAPAVRPAKSQADDSPHEGLDAISKYWTCFQNYDLRPTDAAERLLSSPADNCSDSSQQTNHMRLEQFSPFLTTVRRSDRFFGRDCQSTARRVKRQPPAICRDEQTPCPVQLPSEQSVRLLLYDRSWRSPLDGGHRAETLLPCTNHASCPCNREVSACRPARADQSPCCDENVRHHSTRATRNGDRQRVRPSHLSGPVLHSLGALRTRG